MFDIQDLYDADNEEDDEPTEKGDIRSEKLTNRSIHTIKKLMIRDEASKTTVQQLLEPASSCPEDIWDLDYKSTSDEEDNDSSDEDDYGKVSYPKPRIASQPGYD